jgi:glutamyl-tRNA synthetase
MSVVVRFAPSPTGHLHVGNLRTALVTWLFGRKMNGQFIFRLDDTDTERSKDEYAQSIEHDLKWLGLDWDRFEKQSNRVARYEEMTQKLKDSGRLYPCYETEEELALKRKSLLNRGLPPIYDRSSLKLTEEEKKAYEAKGRLPHWRFKLDHEAIEWNDMVRGSVKFEGKDLPDPVLIREDGRALYHLSSVIDDIDFGVTHIVRGEDHVTNTAAHIQMFQAWGAKPPEFAHLSLLSGKDGDKLSKRLGALSVRELRDQEEIEPMAILSLLAKIGTSDPVEIKQDLKKLVEDFDFSKFSRNMPKFDTDELYRLNAKLLHEMTFAEAQPRLAAIGLDKMDETFWTAAQQNIAKFSDIKLWWTVARGNISPALEQDDVAYTSEIIDLLPPTPWNTDTWDVWIESVKDKTGRKGKQLFMPIRKALTGLEHGPELKYILPLIDRQKVEERLKGEAA